VPASSGVRCPLPPPHLLESPAFQHLEVLRPGPFGGIEMPVELADVITGEPARAPVRRGIPPVPPEIFNSHTVLPVVGG
jgi:hypothetical protein